MAPVSTPLRITNLENGETVHQRCLLVTGTCALDATDGSYIHIVTKGANNSENFPEQTWPTAGGNFKALVMLSPGLNNLELAYVCNDCLEHTVEISVNYIPLLQQPPLHLAIMVAADSPCLIDCPPHKAGGLSSAHSTLDAAVAKLRMTAYMWQAMTAEDMRLKGLGRRTFRFDEEWIADTVSREFLQAGHDGSLDCGSAMRSTAKVHLIRSDKSTKEIRDANLAQQNPYAPRKDELFDIFTGALKTAGGPFTSDARPIVAGLILDSHYNISKKLILGHAALGCHNPDGVSLGMFGSHLTYSWPRFLEEVTACLTDTRAPGDKVGNDNGECGTMWEACTIGQGAHLHEVGHAFGSPHRPGIMERGYAQDWPKHFLSKTANGRHLKAQASIIDDETLNNARWNLADALAFRMLPHFRLPTDPVLPIEERNAAPVAHSIFDESDVDETTATLSISAPCGIARVSFANKHEAEPTATNLAKELRYTETELEQRFDRTTPLRMQVLGFNGKELTVNNVWKLLAAKTFVKIPGSAIRLLKRSVCGNASDEGAEDNEEMYEWAQLLCEKGKDGTLHRATSIDLRVGCIWDGGVVKYADGHKSHWGPMRVHGREHHFGGHASEKINLPSGVEITSIEVNNNYGSVMDGVRMYLSDGSAAGELNHGHDSSSIKKLEPSPNEVIVGFYGKSAKHSFNGVVEFGILTAPKDIGIDGLPAAVWDLPELKNTAGMADGDDECDDDRDGDSDDTMDYDH
ncbi:putative peptidase family-domain-containing protein [Pyrenochaeta sp. MPI-SDFR-AT-0127]|nr:putative peptidase family-domain-containing protein [Pyrenochaeta sp. MPI-SDFR-AT-0127]